MNQRGRRLERTAVMGLKRTLAAYPSYDDLAPKAVVGPTAVHRRKSTLSGPSGLAAGTALGIRDDAGLPAG